MPGEWLPSLGRDLSEMLPRREPRYADDPQVVRLSAAVATLNSLLNLANWARRTVHSDQQIEVELDGALAGSARGEQPMS